MNRRFLGQWIYPLPYYQWWILVTMCVLSCFSRVQCFRTLWLVACQAPLWDSPDKNTGVDCHVLHQGIFLSQRLNLPLLCLLHWLASSLPLSHQEAPQIIIHMYKPIEVKPPKELTHKNHGLQIIMVCQCRFIYCNRNTTLMRMLIMGEAMHVWRQGSYQKSLYLPLNFSVKIKL